MRIAPIVNSSVICKYEPSLDGLHITLSLKHSFGVMYGLGWAS